MSSTRVITQTGSSRDKQPIAGPRIPDMNTVTNWEDVPLFSSEAEEAGFWGENRIDVRLMESAVATGSEDTESVTITLRMDPRMLARIKRLARSRYLNYQSMIKQWLSERMEEEMRER
jgi:predicted DNA binding CopG/RHH family protein